MNSRYFDMIAIDLDGTLIDSVGDLHQAITAMQLALNQSVSPESDIRLWIGNGIERLVHRALTGDMEMEAERELFDKAFDHFTLSYHKTNGQFSGLYEHVDAALQWMNNQNIPIVCVTNKAREFAEPVLIHHKISQYFEHLIAGDDVEVKKPAPDALLKAARLCNVSPNKCLMIGDSISDIKAAKTANFTSICVSYGYNHGINIRDITGPISADLIVDSFAELEFVIPDLCP